MEVPVVGTDVNGVNETVLDGVNGFLVLPASPELLAGRIAELLGNDDLRRRMGQAGRSHVLERFDLQRSVRLMIDTWNGRKVPDRT
jgi:glycosyltransferase involved in cell wall biosynthesis